MSVETHFEDTCQPVYLGDCVIGTKYTDPCTCAKYYQCAQSYDMLRLNCPPGTGFDYTSPSGVCIGIEDLVFTGKCNQTTPWDRCNVTDSKLNELAGKCGGSTSAQPIVTTITTTAGPGTGDGVNTGAIVGGVLGGIVLVVLIIVGYLLWKRKIIHGNAFAKQPSGPVENPQYFSDSDESVYAVIDDGMNEPTYRNDTTMGPMALNGFAHTGTLQSDVDGASYLDQSDGSAFGRDGSYIEPSPKAQRDGTTRDISDAVYDNPGLRLHDEGNPRYSPFVNRDNDRNEQRYSTLAPTQDLITTESNEIGDQNTHI